MSIFINTVTSLFPENKKQAPEECKIGNIYIKGKTFKRWQQKKLKIDY